MNPMRDLMAGLLLLGSTCTASADCASDWALGQATHAPFNRDLAARVPSTVILGRIDPKENARLTAEQRPLATLAPLLNVWFHDRSSAEILRVLATGPAGDSAPAMATALAAIGAQQQADVLAETIALFGRRYPDSPERSKRFGPYQGPPTELAKAVAALAPKFGTRAELIAAMSAYACARPRIVGWLEAEREKMSEQERVTWLTYELLTSREIGGPPEKVEAQLGELPEPYRTLYLARYVDFEVGNGGVHQFFSNSSGSLAPHVPAALRRIGAETHAGIIEKGLAMFAPPYPTERAERGSIYFGATDPRTGKPKNAQDPGDTWGAFDDELSKLTEQGWSYDVIEPAAFAFAKREGVVPR